MRRSVRVSSTPAARLRFDLQTPWWHLGEARQLADAFSVHRRSSSTMPVCRQTVLPKVLRAGRGDAASCRCTDVTVKISGLGQRGPALDVASNRDIVLRVIDLSAWIAACLHRIFRRFLCADFGRSSEGSRRLSAISTRPSRSSLCRNARRIYASGDTCRSLGWGISAWV